MALSFPLSRFTSRVGGGPAFYVRLLSRTDFMTTLELLRQRAPSLSGILDASDSGRLRRISSSIAHAVVARSGLTDPLVTEALQHLSLSASSHADLQARVLSLAEQLDSRYFDLQDLCESGKATEAQVLAAFSKARAATAVASALGDVASSAAAEAAYEAVCAFDDSDYFTGIARSVLTR